MPFHSIAVATFPSEVALNVTHGRQMQRDQRKEWSKDRRRAKALSAPSWLWRSDEGIWRPEPAGPTLAKPLMLPDPADSASKYDVPGFQKGKAQDNRTYSKGIFVNVNQTIEGTVAYIGEDPGSHLPKYQCSFTPRFQS